MMRVVAGALGAGLIVVIMWDAFEAIVLPRRVTRRLRPTRLFYRTTWRLWSLAARSMGNTGRRETYLSFYGPLSLLMLLNMWALSLILGYGLLYWSLAPLRTVTGPVDSLALAVYMSGTTFFTLGLGDVAPVGRFAEALAMIEAGNGFAFLAVVIGYLPVVYQAFSRREVTVSLLDARAGSPPSAVELLRRHRDDMDGLSRLLREWEQWSAEVLESHLSYPVLSFYRSQHDNQSWLAALTTILDVCALVIVGVEAGPARQARLTFAMARHAAVDLAQVLWTSPRHELADRLPPPAFARLRAALAADHLTLDGGGDAEPQLRGLRAMYEPYVAALADLLMMTLPAWETAASVADNWATSAWEPEATDVGACRLASRADGGENGDALRSAHDPLKGGTAWPS